MQLTLNTERYLAVSIQHVPRPIDSDEAYDHWANILEAIDLSPDSAPEDRALSSLMKPAMEAYDRKHNPELYRSDPLASLKFLMESHQMSQADLGRLLGISRVTASHIVNGKRSIFKAAALKLSEPFGLPVNVVLA
jgi:antitoxin component HigA of HigAB toxin-antitoxin module